VSALLAALAGSMNRDVVPAAVNWADINFLTPGSASNANQTISGITGSITLAVSWGGAVLELEYNIDDGASTPISNGGTLSISNGQTLNFTAAMNSPDIDTVGVANQSDGGASLDTFLVVGT
jgi:hypothetical protein